MEGYAHHEIFNEGTRDIYKWVRRVVAGIPDCTPDGELVRCHELTRAISRGLLVPWSRHVMVDGRCGAVDHTWISFPGLARGREVILDCYAPGRLPLVSLQDSWGKLGSLYVAGDPRKDIDQEVVDWLYKHYVEWRA